MATDRFMTAADKSELLDAAKTRFRTGEIGPATFRNECQILRIPAVEIDDYISELSNECADAILEARGYGRGQD